MSVLAEQPPMWSTAIYALPSFWSSVRVHDPERFEPHDIVRNERTGELMLVREVGQRLRVRRGLGSGPCGILPGDSLLVVGRAQ